jgi:hypothetical protein
MIVLIEFDRRNGRLASATRFSDDERSKAEQSRLQLEIALKREGTQREVVILEAASEEDMRRTHRRYFEDIPNLADVLSDNGGGAGD